MPKEIKPNMIIKRGNIIMAISKLACPCCSRRNVFILDMA